MKLQKKFHNDKAYENNVGTKIVVKEEVAGSDAIWIEDGTGIEYYDHGAKLANDYWGYDFAGTHYISNDDAYTLFS